MISADGAMYASKRAGKDRVTGVAMPLQRAARRARPRRAVRCSIRAVSDTDPRPAPDRRAASRPAPSAPRRASRGSTRRRRASRSTRPRPSPRPTPRSSAASPPTRAAGYAYSRISNPTTARSARPTRSSPAARPASPLASGMGAIHAALASLLRAGDRIVAPVAVYGSTRTQLLRVFGGFGVAVDIVDMTDLDAVAAALAAAPDPGPLRRDHRQPDDVRQPTTRRSPSSPIATGRRYVVDNTFASARTSAGRSSSGADLVVESATKFLGGHSDVIAGVVAGPADADRRRRARPDRHRRDARPARGVPRPARDPDPRASASSATRATPRHSPAWLERQDGVRRVLYPGLPSHPQHAVAVRQFRPGAAGGMLAFEVAGGRAAGRAFIDALTLPELTASLGSVHTMVVHPPSTSHRQIDRGRAARGRDHARACCASRSASRTSRTSQADFADALAAARAARPAVPAPAAV